MSALDLPMRPTSLKLPGTLKARLDLAAQKAGVSAHAFMVRALSQSVEHAELREAFEMDCAQALDAMDHSATGYELRAVRKHFAELAAYRAGQRDRPLDLQPTALPR